MEELTELEIFESFGKIPRLSRDIVITEKIDGTNAQICITESEKLLVGSRNRWITPENDNYGFAKWAYAREKELIRDLGIGRHYGEWWGLGIGRGYSMKTKVFSLFNTGRWTEETKPDYCSVVPILYKGPFETEAVNSAIELLRSKGSIAAPNFMSPEGIIIYHTAGNLYFKKTLHKDYEPKGSV